MLISIAWICCSVVSKISFRTTLLSPVTERLPISIAMMRMALLSLMMMNLIRLGAVSVIPMMEAAVTRMMTMTRKAEMKLLQKRWHP